ncbi:inner membrane transporter RhtA [Arthrobacter sp. 49Tsu3.1M3]|uniref:EamA family transporter n=1 Tax=Arthrobacter sp. 49Tsu3.1M3 TaxID=1279029 RepID=UPI0009D0943E|nr:EamA family transporter [Arthrobacter sp. 49Tsu3.1M3]SKB43770.1 inner membrane transporter RhtA [Arthrobacter sp. 49Tsu3.1M3]
MAFGAVWAGQLGGAVSVELFDRISPADLTWLRLVWASVILFAIARPWRQSFSRAGLLTCTYLGVTSGAMTLLYMISITRLPLGTATALQFLGPLSVAVVRSRSGDKWRLVVPVVGVIMLTEPWQGTSDMQGILLALAAGLCWAFYILLTQRAGDYIGGFHALAVSVPVATVVATLAVGPAVITRIPLQMVFMGLVVALLLPVIPYILELLSLRRLTAGAFGILMSLQPAVAVIVGLFFLGQVPHLSALFGILLVVVAGIAATRGGTRNRMGTGHAESPDLPGAPGADVKAKP